MKKRIMKSIIIVVVFMVCLIGVSGRVYADESCEHDWSSWEVEEENTIYHSGTEYRECYLCENIEYRTLPKKSITKDGKQSIKVVKRFLKYTKTYNIKKMKACFASKPKNCFFDKNFTMRKICKKYNKKYLKYSVVDVTSTQKTSKVKMKITYPDGYKAFYKSMGDMVKVLTNHPNISQSNLYKRQEKSIKKRLKKNKMKKTTETITFTMKKTKKGWMISKKTYKIKNTCNCGYEAAYRDYFDE